MTKKSQIKIPVGVWIAVISTIGVIVAALFSNPNFLSPAPTDSPQNIASESAITVSQKDLTTLGWNAYNKDDYEKALSYFQQAVEIDSQYENAQYGLGWSYYKLKKYDNALGSFLVAIKLNPKHADTHNGIGWVYYQTGEYQLAINSFNTAIDLDSNLADAYNGRGWSYYSQKSYDDAMNDFNKALEINPEFENAKEGLQKAQKAKQ